jgi:hypothetical protein
LPVKRVSGNLLLKRLGNTGIATENPETDGWKR